MPRKTRPTLQGGSIIGTMIRVGDCQDSRPDAPQSGVGSLCGPVQGLRCYFGQPRQSGTSHAIFKTPWPGDPRVNIQNARGKAKPYQVRQVLLAVDRIGEKEETEKPQ
jgi:hypothetical protein